MTRAYEGAAAMSWDRQKIEAELVSLTPDQRATLVELSNSEPDTMLTKRPKGTFRGLRDAGLITMHYCSDVDWAELTEKGKVAAALVPLVSK